MGKTYRKGFLQEPKEDSSFKPKKVKRLKPLLDKYTELELLKELNDGYEYPVYEELDRG